MKNLINNSLGKALVVLMAFVFLFTTACTSYKVVARKGVSLQETLKEEDNIRVTTKSGNVYELVNLEITDKTLIGKNFRNGHKIVLPFEAILKLEKKGVSGTAVGLLLVGTMLLVVGLVFAANFDPVGDLSSLGELCFYGPNCPATQK